MFKERFCLAVLILLITASALCGTKEVPLGFKVMDLRAPDYVKDIPIPADFKEQMPQTNTRLAQLPKEDTKRGYVIFSKNYLDYIYPSTRPTAEEITNKVSIFSTPGQYEPATFSIHALKDISKLQLKVGDLKGPGRNTIKASNIDVRTVKCLPRRGSNKPVYTISPSMLEKHPTINIAKNKTQRFWLTVYVPADSAPGIYTAIITISGKSVKKSTLQLQLEVMPFKLLESGTIQGMYCNLVDLTTTPNFKPLAAERIYKDIMNMKEHGMNAIFISYPPHFNSYKDGDKVCFDLEPIRSLIEPCQQAEINTIIFNTGVDDFISNPLGDFKTMLKALVEGFRERGWPEPILAVGDEADANGTLDRVMKEMKQVKEVLPDTLLYETIVFPENSEVFEPYCDIRAFSSYMDETAVQPTIKAGRTLWMYSGASGYGVDTKGDRLYRGLWAGKLSLTGALDWTYWRSCVDHTQPYNDLLPQTNRNNMTCWVFPGDNGPLSTPGWEGLREGVEDEKYIFTLNILIKKARASGDSDRIKTANQAEKFLNDIYSKLDTSRRPDNSAFTINLARDKIDISLFDKFRRTTAEYIIKLNKKCKCCSK